MNRQTDGFFPDVLAAALPRNKPGVETPEC